MGLRPAGWLQGAPRVHGELASVDFLAGRVIGSLRRECLDHVIVLDERHVKLILHGYVGYIVDAGPNCPSTKRRPSLAWSSRRG